MIHNIVRSAGTVDFEFQGVSYRVATSQLNFNIQRELMSLISPATDEEGEIDVMHPSFFIATDRILGYAYIKSGEVYENLTKGNQEKFFTKDFSQKIGGEGWAEVIQHVNFLTLFVYQFLLDDEWVPGSSEISKKKRQATDTKSGYKKTAPKATLSEMHGKNASQ